MDRTTVQHSRKTRYPSMVDASTLDQVGLALDIVAALIIGGDAIRAPWAIRLEDRLRDLKPKARFRRLLDSMRAPEGRGWTATLASQPTFIL